jgi:hypothetical protein
VQYQNWIEAIGGCVNDERDIAQYCDDPQRDHRFHVKRREHEERGNVARHVDPVRTAREKRNRASHEAVPGLHTTPKKSPAVIEHVASAILASEDFGAEVEPAGHRIQRCEEASPTKQDDSLGRFDVSGSRGETEGIPDKSSHEKISQLKSLQCGSQSRVLKSK